MVRKIVQELEYGELLSPVSVNCIPKFSCIHLIGNEGIKPRTKYIK